MEKFRKTLTLSLKINIADLNGPYFWPRWQRQACLALQAESIRWWYLTPAAKWVHRLYITHILFFAALHDGLPNSVYRWFIKLLLAHLSLPSNQLLLLPEQVLLLLDALIRDCAVFPELLDYNSDELKTERLVLGDQLRKWGLNDNSRPNLERLQLLVRLRQDWEVLIVLTHRDWVVALDGLDVLQNVLELVASLLVALLRTLVAFHDTQSVLKLIESFLKDCLWFLILYTRRVWQLCHSGRVETTDVSRRLLRSAAKQRRNYVWNKPIDVGYRSWSALRKHGLAVLFRHLEMLCVLVIEQIQVINFELLRPKRSWSREIGIVRVLRRTLVLKELEINLLELLALSICCILALPLDSITLTSF